MNEPRISHPVSRRSFLVNGGLAFGAALLLGPSTLVPPPDALERLAHSELPPLAVGYVDGSDGLSADEAKAIFGTGGARAVPARSLSSGASPLLGKLATVRIHGLTPGAAGGRAAQLDTLIAPRGGGDTPIPYYAWTLQASGSASRAVSFVTAVEPKPSLGLSFRVGLPGRLEERLAVLTGGRERGLPKLRTGLYLLGLDPVAWAAPRRLPGIEDGAWEALTSLALSVHEA